MLRCLFLAAVGVAGTEVLVWLWSGWCLFPSLIWNDVRLAPTIALHLGLPVYPTAREGIVNTWTYGPVPVVLMWPATFARSAAGALMIAGGLNILLSVSAITVVCASWPIREVRTSAMSARFVAVLLCIGVWPQLCFHNLQADNVAVAFGLIGNLLLVRARNPASRWAAALCAMAALASKQTSLGPALAQILWLLVAKDRGEGIRHAGRCLLSGLALAGIFLTDFGWPGLWYTLIELPSRFPWMDVPHQRLFDLSPYLLIHLGLPAAAMLAWRKWFWSKESPLLLPAITWCAAFPFGFAAMMKLGGSVNSLHGLLLWLPPVLTYLLSSAPRPHAGSWRSIFACLAAVGLASLRLTQVPALPLTPCIESYRQADHLTHLLPDTIWFPWNPLVTLYSERRYYHDEDGMYVRFVSGQPITFSHARRHLPARFCVIALPRRWNSWGIAFNLAPPHAIRREFGLWTLLSWPVEHPPPNADSTVAN